MNKITVYRCEYCDEEFTSEEECKEHEETHIIDYDQKSNQELADELDQLSYCAYGYHINNCVMGMPVSNFKSLMSTAAKRLQKARQRSARNTNRSTSA